MKERVKAWGESFRESCHQNNYNNYTVWPLTSPPSTSSTLLSSTRLLKRHWNTAQNKWDRPRGAWKERTDCDLARFPWRPPVTCRTVPMVMIPRDQEMGDDGYFSQSRWHLIARLHPTIWVWHLDCAKWFIEGGTCFTCLEGSTSVTWHLVQFGECWPPVPSSSLCWVALY